MKPLITLAALALFGWGVSFNAALAEEVSIKQGETNLRADLELAKDKTIKDGVVLMLHGTLAHNQMEIMQSVADLLKNKGYNTLRINLSYGLDKRASSMLDCSIEHKHKHEDAVNELSAWMDWLKTQGASKVVLLGHSRGGNQVVWYASEHDSDLLQKVVAIAPATWDAQAEAKEYKERYKKPLVDILSEAKKLVEAGKGDTMMDLPGFVYCEKAKASAASMLSYYQDDNHKNTPSLLSKVKKPLLIVMGSEDEVVKDLPMQLEKIKLADVKIEKVDGADHFFRDLYADELADKVTSFIDWK